MRPRTGSRAARRVQPHLGGRVAKRFGVQPQARTAGATAGRALRVRGRHLGSEHRMFCCGGLVHDRRAVLVLRRRRLLVHRSCRELVLAFVAVGHRHGRGRRQAEVGHGLARPLGGRRQVLTGVVAPVGGVSRADAADTPDSAGSSGAAQPGMSSTETGWVRRRATYRNNAGWNSRRRTSTAHSAPVWAAASTASNSVPSDMIEESFSTQGLFPVHHRQMGRAPEVRRRQPASGDGDVRLLAGRPASPSSSSSWTGPTACPRVCRSPGGRRGQRPHPDHACGVHPRGPRPLSQNSG